MWRWHCKHQLVPGNDQARNIKGSPCITYSFGISTWSTTELEEMDIAFKFGVHHPQSSIIRLYLPRQQGGRGFLNMEYVQWANIIPLWNYFPRKNSPFLRAIHEQARKLSPLGLSRWDLQYSDRSIQQLVEEWTAKVLNGRYPGYLEKKEANKMESPTYLHAGYLYPGTEGRLAIQDQVMLNRMYQRHIGKLDIPSDRCRKCYQALETMLRLLAPYWRLENTWTDITRW